MNDLFLKKLFDCDRISGERNIIKHTGFLTDEEFSLYLSHKSSLYAHNFPFGGFSHAQRKMVIWPGYCEDAQAAAGIISLIKAEPKSPRFAGELSHRDFLGALMNLGIERECIGDICIKKEEKEAFIFCEKSIAEVILSELSRVKNTDLKLKEIPFGEFDYVPEFLDIKINAASLRADAVLSALLKLSRAQTSSLIREEKVFIGGSLCETGDKKITDGAVISVRGFGKYIFDGIEAESRKGRFFMKIRKYI